MSSIAIRPSRPSDASELHQLAALDSARPLVGDALLAFVDDAPVAALSLTDGRVVADPFERTADIVDLMRIRAARLHGARERARTRIPLRARLGLAA